MASQSRKSQMRYEADERSPDGPYFASIAARGVDIQYVLTGQTAADRLARQTADALHSADDFASIPVHDAFLAAGHSAENDAEAIIGHLAFRREWLSRVGVSAEKARIARVSPVKATRDLSEQEAKGALRRGPEGGRSMRYYLVLEQVGG